MRAFFKFFVLSTLSCVFARDLNKCAEDTEIVILQDSTLAASLDMGSIKKNFQLILDLIASKFSSSKVGIAQFKDKPYIPVGNVADFCYGLGLPLSGDFQLVAESFSLISGIGGGDASNAQLDAIIAASKDVSIGWNSPNRFLILITSTLPHENGDLQKALGHLYPNPMQIPYYDYSSGFNPAACASTDYPTLEDVAEALAANDIQLHVLVIGDFDSEGKWKDLVVNGLKQPEESIIYASNKGDNVVSAFEHIFKQCPSTKSARKPVEEAPLLDNKTSCDLGSFDVILLQETTTTFGLPRVNAIKQAIPDITAHLLRNGPSSRIGAAEFKDKPFAPLGSVTDTCYRGRLSFTNDPNQLQSAYEGLTVYGGGDEKNAHFNALIAASGDSRFDRNPQNAGLILLLTSSISHLEEDAYNILKGYYPLLSKAPEFPSFAVPDAAYLCTTFAYPSACQVRSFLSSNNFTLAVITTFHASAFWTDFVQDTLGEHRGLVQIAADDFSNVTAAFDRILAQFRDGISSRFDIIEINDTPKKVVIDFHP